MSEFQTAIATKATVQAAVAAKPRISADAFRNLTARLKKPDVEIPSLVQAPPVISVQEPVAVTIVPTVEPVVMAEAPAPQPVIIAATPFVEPIVAEVFVETAPALTPVFFDIPAPSVADVVITLDPPLQKYPDLPEYVPATDIQPAITIVPEVVIAQSISFEENFTYVPEPGKPDTPPPPLVAADLAAIDEAVKLEVAERAAELELENIWRLMLAKPTSDDRITYLREAAEIHAADEEWNKPEAEHDLSTIVPAFVPEEIISQMSDEQILQVALPTTVTNLLPVAEGQDLAELTRSLLDMMAAGNASGLPQERALAADTLLRLVPRLELKPLMLVAQRLAMMDSPPSLLVSRLIRDPRVEVAGPLLEDCAHITDKDLEQIIQECEPDKLRMIGRRRKLSRPISDALIKSGDPSVVLTLVRNMEAEISHDGFQSLLVLCENHEELLAPLATRQDLGAPVAFELFWLAPAQLRRFILSRFLTDSETLTKILKITKMANSEDDSEVEPLSQFALLEALERAARGHIDVAAEELSSIMQLSAATVTRILSDLQGEAIVVMLKAAAYPRSSMGGLLKRLQDSELPLINRDRDISELQSMFETLSFNKARILLTYWDWAQSKTGPYAPVN